ncbi:hypothetical protein IU397_12875 [Actibacterium sp. 188UL27-1]|nr:hypothetical protein [Actibacterium sp. 188UL27-1]
MALQRCVWACLANSPGAASAQYHQCVDRRCNAAKPTRTEPQSWTAGVTPGGTGRYVSLVSADRQRSLTYLCDPAGQSYLMLDQNVDGPGGDMAVQVDTVRYQVTFARIQDFLLAPATPNAPVLAALKRGQTAYLLRTDGSVLATLRLSGVAGALDAAIGHCFPA